MKKLPIFEVIVAEGSITTISLVEDPAVEENFLYFSKDHINFKADDMKQIISGVAMVCNKPILRRNNDDFYYVQFNEETIRSMMIDYTKSDKLVNIQHNDDFQIQGLELMESYMIDREKGISPENFEHIPDKSWMISYYIKDKELFNKIKNSDITKGFSIEVAVDLKKIGEKDEVDDFIDEMLR